MEKIIDISAEFLKTKQIITEIKAGYSGSEKIATRKIFIRELARKYTVSFTFIRKLVDELFPIGETPQKPDQKKQKTIRFKDGKYIIR